MLRFASSLPEFRFGHFRHFLGLDKLSGKEKNLTLYSASQLWTSLFLLSLGGPLAEVDRAQAEQTVRWPCILVVCVCD